MSPHFLFLLSLVVAALSAGAAPPNIVFIMSDDHAAHAISCYGAGLNETPHLDQIAREGMRFERCLVTNSICTPSRATILTGKYSHLNGVPIFNRFDGSQETAPKLLQAAGYYTGIIGKWHLGSDPTGFDYWNILPGQGRYVDPIFYTREGSRIYPGYVTDITTDLALEFLQKRPADKPFLLMVHEKAPHREWVPDEKHRAQFASRQIPEAPTLLDDYATRTDAIRRCAQKLSDLNRNDLKLTPPASLPPAERRAWLGVKPEEVETEVDGHLVKLTGEPLLHWKYQRYMQDYLACVQSVDDNVGRLLDWIDSHGLRENTMVIYTSDQGFFLGDHGLFDKRFMYEASLKMPLLVRWPGVVQPGRVEKAMVTNCDFAPTFLAAAGLPASPAMQGRSVVPLLQGEHPPDWRTAMYYRYYHDPGDHNTAAHYGLCTETHKLIYFWKLDQWEMYDLVHDPAELHNLYDDPAEQGRVVELKNQLQRLKTEVKDDDQFAQEQPQNGVDGQRPAWAPGFQPKAAPSGETPAKADSSQQKSDR